jgi:glucose-1-phosphate thymidylyltransferase
VISCLEELAYRLGYINREQLRFLTDRMTDNSYATYLLRLLDEEARGSHEI